MGHVYGKLWAKGLGFNANYNDLIKHREKRDIFKKSTVKDVVAAELVKH
jgi:hypothetical protein